MAFRLRFLIDECLSPKLAKIGIDIADITHVNFRGLMRQPDTVVARWCLDHDHVVVTNNARDFRKLYATFDLHPGVVVVQPTTSWARQRDILITALPVLTARPSLVNTLIEIDDDSDVTFIDWPPS